MSLNIKYVFVSGVVSRINVKDFTHLVPTAQTTINININGFVPRMMFPQIFFYLPNTTFSCHPPLERRIYTYFLIWILMEDAINNCFTGKSFLKKIVKI